MQKINKNYIKLCIFICIVFCIVKHNFVANYKYTLVNIECEYIRIYSHNYKH